jgi:hypothetical protein
MCFLLLDQDSLVAVAMCMHGWSSVVSDDAVYRSCEVQMLNLFRLR